jgi:restriction endonuclease S subunit
MKTRIVRIMDCAAVLPGFSTQGAIRNEPDGTHQVVMGKHLTRGMPYIYREEDHLRIKSERDLSRYVLEPGDILYLSRGSVTYPVLVESIPEPTVAPATFFILTPRPNVVPAYLIWCLEQPQTEAYLAALRTGAGTPTIPRKGFMQIKIPLPEIAVQHRIADLWRLQYKERELQRAFSEEKIVLQRLTGKKLFDKFTQGHIRI